MLLRSRQFVRRATGLGLVLVIAVPATAMLVRNTVLFFASFDVSSAPGGGLQAEVGQITVMAPATEFVVGPAASGGGQLEIIDNGTPVEVTLVGTFKTEFKGSKLDTTWTMSASQNSSPFVVRLVDDSDSGMIDAGFGGNGTIIVGGQPVMPYLAGTSYDFALTLTQPMIGPAMWTVVVTPVGGGATVGTAAGFLTYPGPLTIDAVNLVRPAGASAGHFIVDDLKAVSIKLNAK